MFHPGTKDGKSEEVVYIIINLDELDTISSYQSTFTLVHERKDLLQHAALVPLMDGVPVDFIQVPRLGHHLAEASNYCTLMQQLFLRWRVFIQAIRVVVIASLLGNLLYP
jgi:hypothetical protein